MLEPILKGLVEWIYELLIAIMAYASGELLGVLSMDLSYFERTAPIISDIVDVFIALGWALLIGNLVFQSLKVIMSGAGFESEDPKIIFLRTFVFAFLLLASRQICEIGLSITGTVINLLGMPTAIDVVTPDESMFSLAAEAKWLLVIIVGVVLMVQMVKLLFEIGERYVITSVLTFFAPIAFAMGGSKNTNDVFKGWVRMYCSMLVMMIMNIVFLKLIMSAMSRMTSGGVLIWLVFVVALTRVARKIDSHIGKIGLNPAQTGDGLGSRIPGMMSVVAVRTMSSLVSRSAANAKGGSGGKSGKNGGSGRSGFGGSWRNPHPQGPRPSSGGGNYSSVNHTSGGTVAGSSMQINHGGIHNGGAPINTNIAKAETSTGTVGGSAHPGCRNSHMPNPTQTNEQGTVQQGAQQTTHTTMNGQKVTPQRPPISRNTVGRAGGTSAGPAMQMMGRVHGRTNIPSVPKPGSVGVGHQSRRETVIQGDSPAMPAVVPSSVNQSVSGSVRKTGGRTTVDMGAVHSHADIKGPVQNSGHVSGGDTHGTQLSSRAGNIHMGNTHTGVNVSGHSEHQGAEHFMKQHTEHVRDRNHTDFIQRQSRVETAEKRINHEYKQGKYDPAAVNRKVKKSYYQKDNPLGYRQNIGPQVKRGEKDRK